jgi:hypothetical protein
VELADGRQQKAVMVDISAGGVGLESLDPVDRMEKFTVVFSDRRMKVRLPCQARHVRTLWGKHAIHAAFDDLTAGQVASVDGFIARLQEPRPVRRRSWWRAFAERVGGMSRRS